MAVKEVAASGELGKLNYMRFRNCHSGSTKDWLPAHFYNAQECGGGAMIDLGFNSAYLARYIMGDMESVSSSFGYSVLGKRVEDNASCNVKFKNGAMGVIEASFTSPLLSVFELTVYGTKGAYYARFGGADVAELRLAGEANKIIPLNELPETIKSPVQTWVDACTKGASDEDYGVDAAIDLVKYMIAAYESDRQNGARVSL